MKKLLFIMPSMFIGGAERSLLSLFEVIDYSRYDVSLFLYRHEGEFLPMIPSRVHLLPEMEQYRTFDVSIQSLLAGRKALFGAARLLSKAALRLHCLASGEKRGVWMSMQYTSAFLQPLLPPIPGEYDAAVMFLGVADTLIGKVRAKTRLTWCHTDYDTLYPDRRRDLATYSRVDHVICVSPSCREKLIAFYPALRGKCLSMENVLSRPWILASAEEPVLDLPRGDGVTILSVGRFCPAKNFDNVPDVCARLRRMGLDVTWYLLGYGGDEPLIRARIAEAGMEDHVVVLGKRSNPYPYIAACDLYVQPSRYEGNCVTVHEAQVLGRPVVITRYPTSSSQLEEGVDGVIVPMDNEGCAEGIAALLRDPEKMARLSAACRARDYSNADQVKQLYEIVEGGVCPRSV